MDTHITSKNGHRRMMKVAATSTSPDMTTVFHARPHGRFVKIKSYIK